VTCECARNAAQDLRVEWRAKRDATRGWDSHHCRVLKTKNLQGFTFRTIRRIRTKALVEARIEHAESRRALQRTVVWSL